jgi:hypothetical protein
MSITKIFRLSSSWYDRKRKSTHLLPPSNFDSWTPLERQCFTSLAKSLGKNLLPEARSDYVGTTNDFSPKISDLRAYVGGAESRPGGGAIICLIVSTHSATALLRKICRSIAKTKEN